MPEENVRQLYILIEFSGYVLQIVPVLFLFFVPYEQKYLRVKKRFFLRSCRCPLRPSAWEPPGFWEAGTEKRTKMS